MRKITSIILVAVLCLSCFAVSAFAKEKDVLEFTVENGVATVKDCDDKASGKITVPESIEIDGKEYPVKHIGEKAFSKCKDIEIVVLPEGVTSIGFHAFYECTSLKEIFIPSTLLMCQYDAFELCGQVTVHCYKSNYQFFNVSGFGNNLVIDIIDADTNEDKDEENSEDEFLIVDTYIETFLQFISDILALFGIKWDWVNAVKTLVRQIFQGLV